MTTTAASTVHDTIWQDIIDRHRTARRSRHEHAELITQNPSTANAALQASQDFAHNLFIERRLENLIEQFDNHDEAPTLTDGIAALIESLEYNLLNNIFARPGADPFLRAVGETNQVAAVNLLTTAKFWLRSLKRAK